jgi:hypothetical protein
MDGSVILAPRWQRACGMRHAVVNATSDQRSSVVQLGAIAALSTEAGIFRSCPQMTELRNGYAPLLTLHTIRRNGSFRFSRTHGADDELY